MTEQPRLLSGGNPQIAFFRGAHLDPPPPGTSKQKEGRYLDIREHDSDQRDATGRLDKAGHHLTGQKL